MFNPDFDATKFRQLMLYIADRSKEDPWFGATKLNKILYFCDFRAFAELGRPITGATYMRLSEGPVPRELMSQRKAAIEDEEARIEQRRVFKFTQHRLIPTEPVNLSAECFSHEEQEIIEDTIKFLSPLTAKDVSDLSHQEPGWIMAEHKEPIPYETANIISNADFDIWSETECLPESQPEFLSKLETQPS